MYSTAAKLTLPLIHLNGSGVENLSNLNRKAAGAIETAIRALTDASPHARDFYPLGDDAYRKARAEHEARLDALQAIFDELITIAEHAESSGK